MPRRSRRLNPPCLLDGLSDDLVLLLFSRAPFMTHGTLHVVCRRLKTLLRSKEFVQQRVETGLAEHGLVAAGGFRDRIIADGWMLTGGRWRPVAPLSGPRFNHCSAIVEDEDGQPEMWVMGGYDGGDCLATVEAYNPRTNTWRSCLPLSQRRTRAVAGVVGGRLVVAGGYGGYGSLTSVEAYTPTGWTPLPRLPHAAEGATACVLNGRLYVMGGWGCDKLQVLEMSEENEFTWTVKADLPTWRYGAASIGHEGKIWLIGGLVGNEDGHNNDVMIFDPADDTWVAGLALPVDEATGLFRAAVLDGEVHVTHDGAGVLRYNGAAWVRAGEAPPNEDAPSESILLG